MGEPATYRWIKLTAAAPNTRSRRRAPGWPPKSASPGLWLLQPCGTGACPAPKRERPRGLGLAKTTCNEPFGTQVHLAHPPLRAGWAAHPPARPIPPWPPGR